MSATPVATDPLEVWVDKLRNQDMPIFSATLAAIGEVAENDASPTSALGRIILRDAGMTARVLRMANSVFFHGEGSRINTISRAIVLLGFDTVRNIAISVALIDAFLAGGVRDRVSAEMARCFHAAVHAKHAATVRGDASPEEVFIATLLSRIGELAFWCFSGEAGQQLDRALRKPAAVPEKVESEVLGFRLRSLTQLLAREWTLPGLVANACTDTARSDSREALVIASYRLASAAEAGWQSEKARESVRDYAKLLRQDVAAVAPVVAAHAREAACLAGFYGCEEAAARIPVPARPDEEDETGAPAILADPDPALQFDISRRMVALIAAHSASGAVLDLALEGAGRSLGADRAVLALVTANRSQLAARATHGRGAQQLMRHFNFLLAGAARDALTELVDHGRVIDVEASHVPAPGLPSITRLRSALGQRHQVLVPINAHGHVVGVLYIDRAAERPPMRPGTPDALATFAQLAGIALEASSRKA
ncbi:MAG: HDOD domain-containing protein [Methyloversatilis sp.]|uniref:HDOD domain-containing protein n=1 Tax=Methyloversatilis sp. TaxID=2569862 RepID=UPI001A47A018|nr:HDOD domain-containing protein [Methyloversatilis sp.]MBL8476311.1 HDOD domain-containing protein [Methyloversatilis sp.]